MTAKTRTITLSVTVSAPAWLSNAEIRREIRSRINDQCAYLSGKQVGDDWHDLFSPNDLRVRSVKPGRSPGPSK